MEPSDRKMKFIFNHLVTNIKTISSKLMRKLSRNNRADVDLNQSKPLPILIYQMGKVASRTIYKSLLYTPGMQVFHVHRIGKDVHPNLYERVARFGHPAKIITLVREPISRNISDFFQHLDQYCGTKNAQKKFFDTPCLV